MPAEEYSDLYVQLKEKVIKVIEELTHENNEFEIPQLIENLMKNNVSLNDVITVDGVRTSPTLCKILLELDKEGYILYSSGKLYRMTSNLNKNSESQ